MNLDRFVLLIIWSISLALFTFWIPRNKLASVLLSFMACQSLTWFTSMMHVYFGWISFPVREFPRATDLLFTTEYVFYPLLCAFFVISEPSSAKPYARYGYLALWVSAITLFDVVLSHYTKLVRYERYGWPSTWISIYIEFLLIRIYNSWFFAAKKERSQERTSG